ncbi:hypothetical protein ABPG75_000608 [Micractinium tetrahymenae]
MDFDEMMIEVPAVEDLGDFGDISLSAEGLGAAASLPQPSSEALHLLQPEQSVQQPEQQQTWECSAAQQQEQAKQEQAQLAPQGEQQVIAAPADPAAAAEGEQPAAPDEAAGAAAAEAAAAGEHVDEAAAVGPSAADPPACDAGALPAADDAAAAASAEGTAADGADGADSPAAADGAAPADGTAAAEGTATADGPAAAEGAPAAEGTAGAADEPVEEEDELAANLLSNMSAWQSELDAFQAALRRCMETPAAPAVPPPPSPALGESSSGGGSARLQHNGPKGITGFRGVTQHKRTKRFEANVWMDHKQMYLGAFDVPEQAAHAHDIGALCSGKARPEALNFPLSDYDTMLPMLYSLPHAQIVAALRSYGRLPTARPPGVSSGRLFSSPSVRSASAAKESEDDDQAEGGGAPSAGGIRQRPRRARKPTSASPASRSLPVASVGSEPMDWQAALRLPAAQGSAVVKQEGGLGPAAQLQQLLTGGGGSDSAAAAAGANGIKPEPISAADLARAQQAQLQALSAALMGAGGPTPSPSAAASGASDGPPSAPSSRPPSAKAATALLLGGPGSAARVASFEAVLNRVMARSHELARPDEAAPGESSGGRPLHSGPKGQSGFKGVTLYKRCQRYNAHIWLGKQTHIGTFHTAEQAAVAHDVMELWRNEQAQGLNFATGSYEELLPPLQALSEAEALASLRNYSRSPAAAAAASAAGVTSLPPAPKSAQTKKKAAAAAAGAVGGGGSRQSIAAVDAEIAAQPLPPPPTLRRRHRKPQLGGGGGEAEESSGGSVPAARHSAGSLMWYMLEQEKAKDSDSEDESDPDFSPADSPQHGKGRGRAGSESPVNEPLGFHPKSTPSINAALATDVPEDQPVQGARPPRAGSSHRWGVAVSLRGQAAWFGRLDRQRAAVAADLSLLWRRTMAAGDDDLDLDLPFNLDAGYERDVPLMDQMRRIKTAPQLCQFLAAVVPQDPPAPPGGAAAAAAAAAAVLAGPRMGGALAHNPPPPRAAPAPVVPSIKLVHPPPPATRHKPKPPPVPAAAAAASVGARKRKEQTLLEEARASKLQALAGSGSAQQRPTVAPGGAVAAVAASRLAPSSSAAPGSAGALNGSAQQQQQQGQQGQRQQAEPADAALAPVAAAVQQADTSDSASMLGVLRQVAAVGKGGALLQEVVSGWDGYPLLQQQDLFGALQAAVAAGDWDLIGEKLEVALLLASLF